MSQIKSPIYDDLNITRVLVFLETEPQSNKYQQVLFNKEEFNRTSQTLGTITAVHGTKQDIQIKLSDEVYTLPDLIEIHEPKK